MAPRRPKKPRSFTYYLVDEGLPSQVRVLRLPTTTKQTWELRWRDPVSGEQDNHRVDHSGAAAEEEADKVAARLRDGLRPHVGRAVRARAKMLAGEATPRPRTVLRTLLTVEEEWADQFDKKDRSLSGARYNLEHYVYLELDVRDTTGRPTGETICLARTPLADLETSHIRIWARSLLHTNSSRGRPFSASTVAAALRNLNTLLNFAVKQKYIPENPADGVTIDLYGVKPKDFFEDQGQLFRVLRFLPEWAKAAVIVLAYTGARFGEGAGLVVEAIDTTNHRIFFLRQIQDGKYTTVKSVTSEDFVPYHESLSPILEKHIQELRDASPTAPLFPGQRRGRSLQNSSLNRVLKAACEAAGMDIRVTCHGLRISLASWLAANGVPVTTIQKILRHADIRTTQGYIRVHESQRVEAMATLMEVPHGAL